MLTTQVCLGFQVAVIQFARDMLGMTNATSEEFDGQATEKVIVYMPEVDRAKLGGTMRLGQRPSYFQPGSEWSKLRALYGNVEKIDERHRVSSCSLHDLRPR